MNDSFILRVESPVLKEFLDKRMAIENALSATLAKQASRKEQLDRIWGENEYPFVLDLETTQEEDENGAETQQQQKQQQHATPLSYPDFETAAKAILPTEDLDILHVKVEYWKEEPELEEDAFTILPHHYLYRCGKDIYYASMVTLPTACESIRSRDGGIRTTKTSDIKRMLIVHDVLASDGLTRPLERDGDILENSVYKHGLTPPMYSVQDTMFAKTSAAHRRELQGVSIEDVQQLEKAFMEKMKQYKEALRVEEKRNTQSNSDDKVNVTTSSNKPTLVRAEYVTEEIVEMESFVNDLPTFFVLERGDDHFESSMKELARQIKKKNDDKAKRIRDRERILKSYEELDRKKKLGLT
jgi:hypothetical protein